MNEVEIEIIPNNGKSMTIKTRDKGRRVSIVKYGEQKRGLTLTRKEHKIPSSRTIGLTNQLFPSSHVVINNAKRILAFDRSYTSQKKIASTLLKGVDDDKVYYDLVKKLQCAIVGLSRSYKEF
jgi:hypothetical protein